MPHDPALIAETAAWLIKAAKDLRVAEVDRAVPLTEYAWAYRYPGEPEEPTQQEMDEALALAKEVYLRILGLLPEEVRP